MAFRGCSLVLLLVLLFCVEETSASGTASGGGSSSTPAFFLKQGQKIRVDTLSKTTAAATDDAPKNMCMTTIDKERGIYYIHEFMTPQECEQVIAFGTPDRFARSPLTGGKGAEPGAFYHGTDRTSSTCPLLYARMYMPVIEKLRAKNPEYIPELELSNMIAKRAARLLDTDETRIEPLQMIKYEPGEYYKPHHDHKAYYSREAGCRDRSRTMLLFLNNVDSGGHLKFDKLGLEFVPRQGDAVVWSNVQASGEVDREMVHQGLPPDEGSNPKYAMNIWAQDDPLELS